ncbi:cAMP-dependent protein kinase catalytic subunit [Komagataella kurtzmanii]|nr:cAMP-dependent protein kinase catalytic subunit [Komagataella kurtzmanii]
MDYNQVHLNTIQQLNEPQKSNTPPAQSHMIGMPIVPVYPTEYPSNSMQHSPPDSTSRFQHLLVHHRNEDPQTQKYIQEHHIRQLLRLEKEEQQQKELQQQQQEQEQTEQGESESTEQPSIRVTKDKYNINDFRLVRTLGTGSFGRVHLVRSVHNGRYYAMKVLRKRQVAKAKQIEHTNDERKILAMVQHPFITRMWGTFQDSKSIFLVMEYIEGGELFSLLRKSKTFPNQVAKFYAAEAFLALEYLHSHNIIYRDLKPENILLTKSGHIKLTDFGFAKEVKLKTYTLCGTPDYIAPEVIAVQPYNRAADWWSFGILIYEMLSGTTPFYDQSPMKTYENITRCELRFPPGDSFFQADSRDLLTKLITKDVTYRLGNLQNGSYDIKSHAWFQEVVWENLLNGNIETPYEPNIPSGVGDSSQFDHYPEDEYDYGVQGKDEFGYLFPDF